MINSFKSKANSLHVNLNQKTEVNLPQKGDLQQVNIQISENELINEETFN